MRHRKPRSKTDAFKLDFALTGTSTNSTANRWAVFEYRYDLEAQRQYWQDNKVGILPGWIERNPGTRPYAWWAFDSPEYRQKLSDAGPSNEHLAEIGGGSEFGIPGHYFDDFEIKQDSPIFESEAALLLRHGLMTKAEQSRVKRADFEPETLKK